MSTQPQILLLPKPLPASEHPIGQLLAVTKPTATLAPAALTDRDYDDTHATSWYKTVVTIDAATRFFIASLGAAHLIQRPTQGVEVGMIEAERVVTRTLKDSNGSLAKVAGSEAGKAWLEEQLQKGNEVVFVSAVREAKNASYRRAELEESGLEDMVEVERVISHEEGEEGAVLVKRRDSGLAVETGSNKDVLGLELRRVVKVDGRLELGEALDRKELLAFWQ